MLEASAYMVNAWKTQKAKKLTVANMKPAWKTALVIGLTACLVNVGQAQLVVYQDNYNNRTPGSGFPAWNWTGGPVTHQATFLDYGGPYGIVVQRLGIINNTGGSAQNTRYGSKWDITLSGNTSANPADYTISFDLRNVQGNWNPIQLQLFVLTKEPGADQGRGIDIWLSQEAGWVNYEFNLSQLNLSWWQGTAWNMTNPNWSLEIGGPPWPGWSVQPGESWNQIWLMDNIKITLIPEPSAAGVILAGLGLMIGWRRYKKLS